MKLRHKTTGEEFRLDAIASLQDSIVRVWDSDGFMHYVKREFLEPVPVKEEWERFPYNNAFVKNGVLEIRTDTGWVTYPHPDLRFTEFDGVTVLQRRIA